MAAKIKETPYEREERLGRCREALRESLRIILERQLPYDKLKKKRGAASASRPDF